MGGLPLDPEVDARCWFLVVLALVLEVVVVRSS